MRSLDATLTDRRLEIVTTVLLALATVGTAWAAYQSRQWTGEQSQGYSRATATRIAVNRTSALANRQVEIDVATFIQWIDAHERHDDRLAAFYEDRFRDEFRPAFEAWLAAKPFDDPNAPRTPFALSQYRLKAAAEADRLERVAAVAADGAKTANARADDYLLAVVLFASTLFFAGISLKLHTRGARLATLGIGAVLFLAAVVWLAVIPVHLTT